MSAAAIERVWVRLLRLKTNPDPITKEDEAALIGDIGRKLSEGWTEDEIVGHMRYTEYITVALPEEVCLRKMREQTDKVMARLKGDKVQPIQTPLIADDLLNPKNTDALIEQMDRVRPDWWTKFTDDTDRRMMLQGVKDARRWIGNDVPNPAAGKFLIDYDRFVTQAKRSALRHMQDAVWVMGHSMLSITPKYVSLAAEFENWIQTEGHVLGPGAEVGDAEEALRELLAKGSGARKVYPQVDRAISWLEGFIVRWETGSMEERFGPVPQEHKDIVDKLNADQGVPGIDEVKQAWRIIARKQIDANKAQMETDKIEDPNDDILAARCVDDYRNHLIDAFCKALDEVLEETK